MKRLILVSILCLIGTVGSFSQSNDSIFIKKRRVFQNEKQLTGNDLYQILKSKPISAPLAEKAHSNTTLGSVFMVPGTILCLIGSGITLASSIKDAKNVSNGDISTVGADNSLGFIAGGAVLVCVGLPFMLKASNQNKKAIALYNSGISARLEQKVRIEFRAGLTGVGFVCRF